MTAAQRQVRSSSILVGGRLFAIAVNLGVQVLTVRYLSQSDYGAFAYALSLVAMVETISTLGLDRTVGRFVPTYHEQGDVARLFGTLVTVVATAVTVGLGAVVVIAAGVGLVIGPDDQLLRTLVVLLVALGPIQALDHLSENFLAAFGRARGIVLRRHILGPLLKLGAVLVVVSIGSDVQMLASAYVITGLTGMALYVPLLVRTLRDAGLLGRIGPRDIRPPVRELFAFALPLLAIDAALVVRTTVDAIIVEAHHGTDEVAILRSVQPIARLNQLIFGTFAIMYTPLAARILARKDDRELDDLYWQAAAWQALASFPIVAVTAILATDVAILLFGDEYAAAGPVLALLAIGYYANAATGQNALTLRVVGRIRWIVGAALVAGGTTLALDVALIPGWGAVGAAAAAAIGLILQNVVNQVGLHRRTVVGPPTPRLVRFYAALVGSLVVLAVIAWLARPGLIPGIALTVLVTVMLAASFRSDLRVGSTFPEMRRLPVIGRWL